MLSMWFCAKEGTNCGRSNRAETISLIRSTHNTQFATFSRYKKFKIVMIRTVYVAKYCACVEYIANI